MPEIPLSVAFDRVVERASVSLRRVVYDDRVVYFDGHADSRGMNELWVLDDNGSSDNAAMRVMWALH